MSLLLPQRPPQKDLLGHWLDKYNHTPKDGVIPSSVGDTSRLPQPGRAYDFDGVDDKIEVPHNANWAFTESDTRTLIAVVKPSDATTFRVASIGALAGEVPINFTITSADKLFFGVGQENSTWTSDRVGAISTNTLTSYEDSWIILYGSFSPNNFDFTDITIKAFQINGTEIDLGVIVDNSVGNFTTPCELIGNLDIGEFNNDFSNGVFSKFALYKKELTDQEILNFAYGEVVNDSKILFLAEDTGLIAFDSSGNGNHGTKVNTDVLGANTFSYTGNDVPKSYQNDEGYSVNLQTVKSNLGIRFPREKLPFNSWDNGYAIAFSVYVSDLSGISTVFGAHRNNATSNSASTFDFTMQMLSVARLRFTFATEGSQYIGSGNTNIDVNTNDPSIFMNTQLVRVLLSYSPTNENFTSFVNGVAVGTTSVGSYPLSEMNTVGQRYDFFIGSQDNATFTGILQNLEIYETEFDSTDIAYDYESFQKGLLERRPYQRAGTTVSQSDLIFHYKGFDVEQGTTSYKEHAQGILGIPEGLGPIINYFPKLYTGEISLLKTPLQYKGQVSYPAKLVESNCLSFDGVDDYIDFGIIPSLRINDFIVAFQFKTPDSFAAFNYIFGVESDFNGGDRSGYATFLGTSGEFGYGQMYDASLYESVTVKILELSTWYTVTIIKNGLNLQVYINGIPELSHTLISSNINYNLGTESTIIGSVYGTNTPNTNYGEFNMTYFKLFNYSLSNVSSILNNNFDISSLLSISGAEGNGTTVFDDSGNNNHGTLVNGVSWGLQDVYHYNYENGFKVLGLFNSNTDELKLPQALTLTSSTHREVEVEFTIEDTITIDFGFSIASNSTGNYIHIKDNGITIRPNAAAAQTYSISLQSFTRYSVRVVNNNSNYLLFVNDVEVLDFINTNALSIEGLYRSNAGINSEGLRVHKYRVADIGAGTESVYIPNKYGQLEDPILGTMNVLKGSSFVQVPLTYTFPLYNDRAVVFKPSLRNHNGAETKIDFNPYNAPALSELGVSEVVNNFTKNLFISKEGKGGESLFYKNLTQENRITNYLKFVDPDAQAIFARMPNSLLETEKTVINNWAVASKISGNITKYDYLFGHFLSDPANALIDWITGRIAIAVNSPLHTANQGFSFNGTTQYIDTNFNLVADSNNFTRNDNNIGFYCYQNNEFDTTTRMAFGTSDGSKFTEMFQNIGLIRARNNTTASPLFSFNGVDRFKDNSRYELERVLNGTLNFYENSIFIDTATGNTDGVPNSNMWIGARNNNGSPSFLFDGTISYNYLGRGFNQEALNNELSILENNLIQ